MRIETVKNAFKILREGGIKEFLERTKVHHEYMKKTKNINIDNNFKDILFINGCPIDYCERYRVLNKIEELLAYGITCDETIPEKLNKEMIKYYRGFIIYRTPWTKEMEDFIKIAKSQNKKIFYDIDDLVFDLNYTKQIKALSTLSPEEKELYDDGVIRYGKLLNICDYGITTTKKIRDEMTKKVKDVCIDKNIASLELQKFSEFAISEVKKEDNKIIMGYASGSSTHNDDLNMILPHIINILKKYNNVYLKLIGAIEYPKELETYKSQIIISPFVNFKKLPYELRKIDINLAPLQNNIFNEAKSSIKWMEAALVKVPTIASDIGDFKDSITNNVNGILCRDADWFERIEELVLNRDLRESIAENAYNTVYSKYTAVTNGKNIADFINNKLNKKICFVIPSANLSGGILVATKHAIILKNNGYDVSMLNTDLETKDIGEIYYGKESVDVISTNNTNIDSNIDMMVATMWHTLNYAMNYAKQKDIRYLVQGRETSFYKPDKIDILLANATYYNHPNIKYLTISKWCKKWLEEEYDLKVSYVPNGIDIKMFPYKERSFNGKIKILIEGDSKSFYKNVDESFLITNKLNKEKYEIHYLSYNGEPKDWYKVDKFYNKVQYDEVYKIYQKCDILIKSSILESFSYPPLEMMATGGITIACLNSGNEEYLLDGYNCLIYEQGNIEDAIKKIDLVTQNKKVRDEIIKNGKKTVEQRNWDSIENEIINLYK